MLKIKEAIVVEGRYDKNTLSQVVDALIIPVDGFQIFKKKDTVQMLRKLAATQGLIIFTDSDGAGFIIRNHLKGVLPQDRVKHAYIPDIYGKERRKATAGKEGKLGVEGMRPEVLKEALLRAGARPLCFFAPLQKKSKHSTNFARNFRQKGLQYGCRDSLDEIIGVCRRKEYESVVCWYEEDTCGAGERLQRGVLHLGGRSRD